MVGTVVAHYRIVERIGGGGMGVVYRAEDLNLERPVVLKFLPAEALDDPAAVERFRREARAASALNHPNICTIHNFGEHDGQKYLVLELLEGQSLQSALAKGPLPVGQTLTLAADIVEALAVAHARGIVHRDIKPANIFITSHGHAKVLDFGLAKIATRQAGSAAETITGITDLTHAGTTLGTLPYMSPEQARGQQVDARSDLFSFGAVLYEMVTGVRAFQGTTPAAIFEAVVARTPAAPVRLNPLVPAELERIIAKALEKDPATRYQSAAEMRADLRRAHRDTSGSGEVPAAPVISPAPAHSRAGRWIAGGALVALLALALLLSSRSTAPALAERAPVLIADFENATGETVFDGTLKAALAIHVEQSPYFNVVSEQRVRDTLRLMNRSPDERVSASVAREICERQGIPAVLVGSIAPLGSSYVITLEGISARRGETLAREQAQAGSREGVLAALGGAASKLRRKLGESVASVERFDRPLPEATTSSLEALRVYTEGRALFGAGQYAEAIPFYLKAVELDPDFAMAHGGLVAAYSNIGGHADAARRAAARAFELRDRVTERERYSLTHYYLLRVQGDVLRARENLELAVRAYPDHYSFHSTLAFLYSSEGKYEQAVAHAREGLRVAGAPVAVLYSNHASALRALGRYGEAKETVAEAHAKGLDAQTMHRDLMLIAFVEDDRAGIERELAWAKGKRAEPAFARLIAFRELFEGRRPARALAAVSEEGFALELFAAYHAALGDCTGATLLLSRLPAGEPSWMRPVPLALCGDLDEARRALDDLSAVKEGPYATERDLTMRLGEALVEHARGNFALARQKLQPALKYQLGQIDGFWTTYVTGLTYLGERRGAEAAAEFEKILGRRSVDPVSPLYPLSHLGLARAATLAGDTARARRAYEDLLALWRNADPDLPALVAAKAEYGRRAQSGEGNPPPVTR